MYVWIHRSSRHLRKSMSRFTDHNDNIWYNSVNSFDKAKKNIDFLELMMGGSTSVSNINGRDVQRKNVVNNVDKSRLWVPWLNSLYKNTQNITKHRVYKDSTDITIFCFVFPDFYTPTTKCGWGGYTGFALSRRSVVRSVRPSTIRVRSITPLLIEGFPSNLNDTFTTTRGCAEPMLPMCQLKVKVTV